MSGQSAPGKPKLASLNCTAQRRHLYQAKGKFLRVHSLRRTKPTLIYRRTSFVGPTAGPINQDLNQRTLRCTRWKIRWPLLKGRALHSRQEIASTYKSLRSIRSQSAPNRNLCGPVAITPALYGDGVPRQIRVTLRQTGRLSQVPALAYPDSCHRNWISRYRHATASSFRSAGPDCLMKSQKCST